MDKKRYSRRQFLKGIPLGVIGAVAISVMLGRGLKRRRQPPEFAEDSIFKPARNNRNKV